jgi:hypothetical protein
MNAAARLYEYAQGVLAFRFKDEIPAQALPDPVPEIAARLVRRCREAFARSGRKHLLLFGLGSGVVAGLLARELPPAALVVCERDLSLVRLLHAGGALPWFAPDGPACLAADSSCMALFLLLDRMGVRPEGALALPNPELPPAQRSLFRPLELLFAQTRSLPPLAADLAGTGARISAGAILSPAEPDLPEFFAQFPAWLRELVLVWDAQSVPDIGIPAPPGLRVKQIARPLARDFSAQRNAMLAQCGGDFVFYLDADERLSPDGWAALTGLCSRPEIAGWHFPRLCPYPDEDHALTGFGLWPDVQLRLFRRAAGVRFVNSVHERIVGLEGRQALAPDAEIIHESRLRKTQAQLAAKLSGFDAAGGGGVRHTLSAEYPRVSRGLIAVREAGSRGLLLPSAVE